MVNLKEGNTTIIDHTSIDQQLIDPFIARESMILVELSHKDPPTGMLFLKSIIPPHRTGTCLPSTAAIREIA